MPKLHLIRGLPGAGKSTFASNNREDSHVVEADQFFLNKDIYEWKRELLWDAHRWCQARTVSLLKQGINVTVANTFVTRREMLPYLNMVNRINNLEIKITEVYTQFQNIHGVPPEKIVKMASKWQNIPEHWIKDFNLTVNRVE
jgi:predicted sulfurtransferase